MSNILIINAHHKYPFAEGRLNGSLVQKADELLTAGGHTTRVVTIDDGWDVDRELENHQWADIVLLQTPVNWMGVPWTFKKYMDEVYTAGMGGQLCDGDGRHRCCDRHRHHHAHKRCRQSCCQGKRRRRAGRECHGDAVQIDAARAAQPVRAQVRHHAI